MEFNKERKTIDLVQWNLDQRGISSFEQPRPPSPTVARLKAEESGTDALLLEGDFEGKRVRAVLHHAAPAATIRTDRHFRWVPTGPKWGKDIIM